MKFLSIFVLLAGGLLVNGCQTATTTASNQSPVAQTAPAVNATPVVAGVPPVVSATPVVVGVTPTDDVARISLAEAKAAFDTGTAVFVDSRAEAAWKAERIKGAINIMVGQSDAKLKQLPKDKKIIVYCS